MSLRERTVSLLRKHRISPNKLLGQNFTVDSYIMQRMIGYASLSKDDVVLDVGAGLGFLTQSLAENCKSVVAVEADKALADVLSERFSGISNIRIIKGNVLKVRVPRFNKVVSIPPYRISSRLVSWLFDKGFERAVLVFQKEFANRLKAPVGSDNYGWLTVIAYHYAETELLDPVPKSMFYPVPNVDSIVVRLSYRKHKPFSLKNEPQFKRFVQSLFTDRNRKVRNAILPFLEAVQTMTKEEARGLVETVPFRERRIRELTPEDFGALANVLIKQ